MWNTIIVPCDFPYIAKNLSVYPSGSTTVTVRIYPMCHDLLLPRLDEDWTRGVSENGPNARIKN